MQPQVLPSLGTLGGGCDHLGVSPACSPALHAVLHLPQIPDDSFWAGSVTSSPNGEGKEPLFLKCSLWGWDGPSSLPRVPGEGRVGAAGSRAEGASFPAGDTGLPQSGFCPALTHPPRAQEVLTRPLGAARSWREGVPALIVAPDQLLHFFESVSPPQQQHKACLPRVRWGLGHCHSQRQQEATRLVVSLIQCQVSCPTGPSRWPVFMIRHVHTPRSCPRGTWFPASLTVVRV